MKFRTISLLLLTSLTVSAQADTCLLVYGGYHSGNRYAGPTHCAPGTVGGITVNGPLQTTNTMFTGPVIVRGPLNSSDGKFQALTVDGPYHAKAANILGAAEIRGPAHLSKTHTKSLNVKGPLIANKTWMGAVTIYANYSALTDCRADGITMINHSYSPKTTKLYIQGKSTIKGNVAFEGKPGVVYLNTDSKITGKVINGQVKHA